MAVTLLPKKSLKSERSAGPGEKDSDAATTRCVAPIVNGITRT